MEQHFIVCGLGRVGARVLEHLRAAGAPLAVIDNRVSADDVRLQGIAFVHGDCRQAELWHKANLAKAQGVLILTSDDLVNISTALMVRNLNPTVRIVVRMFNESLMARLSGTVNNIFALSTSALAAPLLALVARTGTALGTFAMEDGDRHHVSELSIQPNSSYRGRSIAEVLSSSGVQALAYFPSSGKKFIGNEIDPKACLAARDRLVVCGEAGRVSHLLGQAVNESMPQLLWAGFLRRQGRVAWRALKEVDLPVKICTAALMAVIVVSVLVFHLGMQKDTLVDAFYRTISLMATAADMGGGDQERGAWQKAFISIVRLLGLALVASFTAIFTNYLVRAHLGGALEVRRIPERGHIIVCGLGNVGFRVVQELLRHGERVVAIEKGRDVTFIPTARRLGVAVIIGDAALKEVLRQANASTARAVVAATSNELVNLETALLVRELDPNKRVVLRLTDTLLARTLREAADVRLALSIPELAGPAFVAALYGERVRSVFSLDERLFAVVDLAVQSHDPLLEGKTLKKLGSEFQILPLFLRRSDRTVTEWPDMPLQAGDRLTAILSLAELQRFLQREKVPEKGLAIRG